MNKEKILSEHEAVKNSLIEKVNFIYSEEFHALDDTEKKKYMNDKVATEGHLNALSTLLWSNTPQLSGVNDMWAFLIFMSMFHSWGNSTSSLSGFKFPTNGDDDPSKEEEKVAE